MLPLIACFLLLGCTSVQPAPAPPAPAPAINFAAPPRDDRLPIGTLMPRGTAVMGPAGYYDYCRRERAEDQGCAR